MALARSSSVIVHLPDWVPEGAQNYLIHTVSGLSIRALARATGVHASTILRQVRRFESRRDDPLVDGALRVLADHIPGITYGGQKDTATMKIEVRPISVTDPTQLTESRIEREALRVLRRLVEPGAVMAVARNMEMAVVVRDGADGVSVRTAVVDQAIAQAMALRDWVATEDPQARIVRYRITGAGRAILKKLMAASENRAQGFAEAAAGFDGAGKDRADREDMDDPDGRMSRYSAAESPLAGLSRRKDKDGQPFLTREMVAAGERLREDFELAQMGTSVTQNWDRFLTGQVDGSRGPDAATGGPSAARARVASALSDLGPGLGDVVLRCCCYLEGLEQAERRMGWAARSGKIVLRIALQRLKRHYDELGHAGKMIG